MFAYKLLAIVIAFSIAALIWQQIPRTVLVTNKLNSYYDYIIVGGGTAGCVLANRLSADPDTRVLLLEAGGEEIDYTMIDIPLAATELHGTDVDWRYRTTPQNHSCLGMEDQRCLITQGKVLGGSSSINNMMYIRGSKHDYDEWAGLGNEGWSYDEVLPYFIRAEANTNGKYQKNGFHGKSGAMFVSDSMATPKLTHTFLNAARELGHKVGDCNGKNQHVACHIQTNTHWGRRHSSATAYLRPVMRRKNLDVSVNVLVTKILLKNERAIGVEITRNKTIKQIHARKEVIVSAGTIGSSKLLMLSGIGPKEHLNELGIPVIADLPVGLNVQNHYAVDALQYSTELPHGITSDNAKSLLQLFNYLILGEGVLTSGGAEAQGFYHVPPTLADKPHPSTNIQLLMVPLLFGEDNSRLEVTRKSLNLAGDVFDSLYGRMSDRNGFMVNPVLLKPNSRGTIQLSSTDPQEPPIIDLNQLSSKHDVDTIIEGIRLGQQFATTNAFDEIDASLVKRIHSRCKTMKYDSHDYWSCFVKHNVFPMNHYVGSCRMGRVAENTTVVDPMLRVKGIDRLRVVDASIMPIIVAGNTAAPVVMIAEKAAEMIVGRKNTGGKTHKDHDEL